MAADRKILGIGWCPACQQDAMAMRNGTCGFCDTPLEDAPTNTDRPPTRTAPQEATVTETCKQPGCDNESAGKKGPWVGMCSEHISTEMARRHALRGAKTAKPKPKPKPKPVERAEAVAIGDDLVALARAVEEARAAYDSALARLREAVAA